MIDELGWQGIEWDGDYTLLHWAAKHDMADLVARFLLRGADPYHCDDFGKTAYDYAEEKNCTKALKQLEKGPPAQEPPVLMVPISNEPRKSIPVKARVKPQHQAYHNRAWLAAGTAQSSSVGVFDEEIDLTMQRSQSAAAPRRLSTSRRKSRVLAQLRPSMTLPAILVEPEVPEPELWPTFFHWDVSAEDFNQYSRLDQLDSQEFGLSSYYALYLRLIPRWDSRSSCLKLLAPRTDAGMMRCALWIDEQRQEGTMRDVDEGEGYTSFAVFFPHLETATSIWAELLE